jgi:leucyl aminopeptidase
MDVHFQDSGLPSLDDIAADAVMLVLVGDSRPDGLGAACKRLIDDAIALGDLSMKPGSKAYLHRPAGLKAPRLAVAVAADGTPKSFKAACSAALGLLPTGVKKLAAGAAGLELQQAHAEALAVAAVESAYQYRHTKPSAQPGSSLAKLELVGPKAKSGELSTGLRVGRAIAEGVACAKELGNRPGNHCTPTFLGNEAKRIGKRYGIEVQVHDRKSIERIGMGSFLAVAQGSDQPPVFIVMRWRGNAAKGAATHVLVGKGITFDSGGISIKPAGEMDEMKYDMGGAASVLGTMTALGELKPRVNVVGLIPSCENLPSGRAVKPGDVITSLSGKTIEVLNTDAEGRLILCDALTYAQRYEPASIVDIATLTGACVIALGHYHTGLFSPNDELATDLLAASRRAIDPAWRMPLDAEYDDGLKSTFADVPNIGGRAGGAITAAKFLERFTDKKVPWAHLDVAGTAWKTGAAKGATGRPVGLLTHYLLSAAGKPAAAGSGAGNSSRAAKAVKAAKADKADKADNKAGSTKARRR